MNVFRAQNLHLSSLDALRLDSGKPKPQTGLVKKKFVPPPLHAGDSDGERESTTDSITLTQQQAKQTKFCAAVFRRSRSRQHIKLPFPKEYEEEGGLFLLPLPKVLPPLLTPSSRNQTERWRRRWICDGCMNEGWMNLLFCPLPFPHPPCGWFPRSDVLN